MAKFNITTDESNVYHQIAQEEISTCEYNEEIAKTMANLCRKDVDSIIKRNIDAKESFLSIQEEIIRVLGRDDTNDYKDLLEEGKYKIETMNKIVTEIHKSQEEMNENFKEYLDKSSMEENAIKNLRALFSPNYTSEKICLRLVSDEWKKRWIDHLIAGREVYEKFSEQNLRISIEKIKCHGIIEQIDLITKILKSKLRESVLSEKKSSFYYSKN